MMSIFLQWFSAFTLGQQDNFANLETSISKNYDSTHRKNINNIF